MQLDRYGIFHNLFFFAHFADLVSEYQQYQEATADDDDFEEEEEEEAE